MSEAPKKAGNPNWVKSGRSPNPSGKSKLAWLTDALKRNLAQDPARAARIAEKLLTMCEEGEMDAIKVVLERVEGKVAQAIDVSTTTINLTPEERKQRVIELQSKLAGVEVEDAEFVSIEAPRGH
jgi:hypothetical protein